MGIIKDKLEKMSYSDEAKAFLSECIDENQSILRSSYGESLFHSIARDLKDDNGMLGFLLNLADSNGDQFIKLPHYIPDKRTKLKNNEISLNEYGKYGILLNIISNKKTFNFSIRLKDMTIIRFNYELKKQERGSYRSFTLTDKFGNISENWKTLKAFKMSETKQIFDNHNKHDKLIYNDFVSDALANKLLDIKYFLLKCYINRLVWERDYWKDLQQKAIERIDHYDAEYEMNLIKQELHSEEEY